MTAAAVIGGSAMTFMASTAYAVPAEPTGSTHATDGAPTVSADQNYELVLEWGGRCLEEWGGSVYQWDCHGGDHQQWRFVSKGDGYYQIVNKRDGLCLDVYGGSPQNGTSVVGAGCHEGKWQQWSLNFVGAARYELVARHSGRCLDIAHGGNGSKALQWDCHHGGNQRWYINEER
ncbi:RICIN domain-containing protein [Streptomyces sp. NPDC058471]|uniref:RICIN domain-containing protein n=1 Tax=Streptomyces sp. NPDC058471 TaxID=3346516 RepID=UPI0036493077